MPKRPSEKRRHGDRRSALISVPPTRSTFSLLYQCDCDLPHPLVCLLRFHERTYTVDHPLTRFACGRGEAMLSVTLTVRLRRTVSVKKKQSTTLPKTKKTLGMSNHIHRRHDKNMEWSSRNGIRACLKRGMACGSHAAVVLTKHRGCTRQSAHGMECGSHAATVLTVTEHPSGTRLLSIENVRQPCCRCVDRNPFAAHRKAAEKGCAERRSPHAPFAGRL